MALLTDQIQATGVSLTDLIHIVITGDTSQNPAGSSYKATIQQVARVISGTTGTSGTSGSRGSSGTSGQSGIGLFLPLSGGTVTGNTIFNAGLSAITISATTYQNLPSDVIIIDSTQIQSGFTGGVLFQSSASTVSQTTGFTWNNTNKRLGIGINSPLYDLDVNGSIYQRTGELLITSTGGVNKEGPFIASSGGDDLISDRKIQLGISDNSTVPVGINMFVTNNSFPPSYMNFRVNNADLVRMSGSSVEISGLTYTSGITSTSKITFPQITINSGYTVTDNDYMVDVTGGTFTVNLPSAVGRKGRLLVIKNNGGGAVTVDPFGSETIDGKLFVILGETNSIQLSSNGTEWVALGYNISTVNSSTGVFEFTGITTASPTTFNVAPVKGWIVDDTTNPLSPQLYYVVYTGGTNTATYVTTSTETWIYLTSGGTISQSNIPLTEQERRQNIFLGKLGHANKTSIINSFSQPDFVLSPLSQLRDMFTPINLINGGITPSPNGVNLSFNTSAEYLYGLGINFANDILSPDSLYVSGTAPCTFQYRTQTGGTASNTTFIDPTKYDVGGTVTSIPGTKATNQRIYLVQNGVFRVQYGQTVYSTLTQAVAGISTEQYVEFSNFQTNGILIGILSVLSSCTDLSDTSKALFFQASKFGESTGAAGGTPTTNLQQAYNNSSEPEILTNSTLGAFSIKNGTGNPDISTNLFEGIGSSGVLTSSITARGVITGTSISTNGTISGGAVTGTTMLASTFNLAGSQIESAWESYSVSWTSSGTNPVIGNGTIEGWYKVIGKTCFVRGNIVMGSTTTFGTGEWYVSMPVTAVNADAILMTVTLLDNGSAWYNATMAGARAGFNTKAPMQYVNILNGTANDVNATQPFTWTTSDRFVWNGSYEIA